MEGISFDFDYDGGTMSGLSTIKINRAKALERITENRVIHKSSLMKARAGWREEVIRIGYELTQDAEALACEQQASIDTLQAYIRSFERPPRSYLADYDRAIAMLQWSEDEHIEFTQQEFDQYILDNWSWKQDFMLTNSKYGA